jgi:thioredoxin 1
MEFKQLFTLEEIEDACTTNAAAVFYFSTDTCNVCKVLRPKVARMLDMEFPLFRLYYVNIEQSPLLAGQYRIFSIPTILVFFDGKEFFRKSRNISLTELENEIHRPYSLLFND